MNILDDVRVISFNHFLMGPLAIQHLADLGAEVIAIEPVDGAFQRKWGGANTDVDGQSMLLLTANRNKKSLALDLKHPRGIEVAKELIRQADIVAENYRPGVMDRLGLGYEDVKKIKPDIIYAIGSGYGPKGPLAKQAGQDLLVQAMSGLATISGSKETGPKAVGVSVVDHHGAALLALGILAAILRQRKTGVGCLVDVGLLDAAIDLQFESLTCYLNSQGKPDIRSSGPLAGWYFPAPYGIYSTKDGHVAISLGDLEPLYEVLDVPENRRIPNRESYERRDEINLTIAQALGGLDLRDAIEKLSSKGIWHSKVNDYEELIDNPQVRYLDKFQTIAGATGTDLTLVGHPIRFDGKAPAIRRPPERLGSHTAEILSDIVGLTESEIGELSAEGIVRCAEDD